MTKSTLTSHKGVLIVGAGPTGLALANALRHYNIPFSIIDRKQGPSQDSKGLTLSLGTQYALNPLGLMEEVGNNACGIMKANIYWEGHRFSSINFRNTGLPVHSLKTQPQPDTEHELINALGSNCIYVQWDTCLVDIRQEGDCVEAVLEDSFGNQTIHSYPYAVGCEGKFSLIREKIGAVLSGRDYSKHFVLGDFPVATELSKEEIYYHVHKETFFILIPIGGDLWRIVVKYDGDVPKSEPDVADITDVINHYMGDSFILKEPVWLSSAPFYMRTSNKLKKGGMFIAGDAAHLFSPIGGTGMNTGIQDALNLAWKLALHYQGYARDSIFDAYEVERLEVINETANVTDKSTRLICGELENDPILDSMRPLMRNRNNFRTVLPVLFSGLGNRYSKCYAAYNNSSLAGASALGSICFGRGRLESILKDYKEESSGAAIMIAAYLDGPIDDAQNIKLQLLNKLIQKYQAILPAVIFCHDENPNVEIGKDLSCVVLCEGKQEIVKEVGLVAGALLVVAPDGYVVFSGSLDDITELEKIIQKIFSLAEINEKLCEVS